MDNRHEHIALGDSKQTRIQFYQLVERLRSSLIEEAERAAVAYADTIVHVLGADKNTDKWFLDIDKRHWSKQIGNARRQLLADFGTIITGVVIAIGLLAYTYQYSLIMGAVILAVYLALIALPTLIVAAWIQDSLPLFNRLRRSGLSIHHEELVRMCATNICLMGAKGIYLLQRSLEDPSKHELIFHEYSTLSRPKIELTYDFLDIELVSNHGIRLKKILYRQANARTISAVDNILTLSFKSTEC